MSPPTKIKQYCLGACSYNMTPASRVLHCVEPLLARNRNMIETCFAGWPMVAYCKMSTATPLPLHPLICCKAGQPAQLRSLIGSIFTRSMFHMELNNCHMQDFNILTSLCY